MIKMQFVFLLIAGGLACCRSAIAIDCSVSGCKICEKLVCGEPTRTETRYAGRTISTITYYMCNDGAERTIVEFCSASCSITNDLPSGSPVSHAVSNALSSGTCDSTGKAIAISGASSCSSEYFELPACAKSSGNDSKGAYKYTCN